jgi:hypothetical protein
MDPGGIDGLDSAEGVDRCHCRCFDMGRDMGEVRQVGDEPPPVNPSVVDPNPVDPATTDPNANDPNANDPDAIERSADDQKPVDQNSIDPNAVDPPTGDPAAGTVVTTAFRADLIASWLATGTAPRLLVELGDQIIASGYALHQVHPGTADRDLAVWFEVRAPDALGGRRALAMLRGHPAVAAAFIKPAEEPPG